MSTKGKGLLDHKLKCVLLGLLQHQLQTHNKQSKANIKPTHKKKKVKKSLPYLQFSLFTTL